MLDPQTISDAINNTVGYYLWTHAIIGWITGALIVSLLAVVFGCCFALAYWLEVGRYKKKKDQKEPTP